MILRAALLLAAGAALLALPFYAGNNYVIHVATVALMYAILAASWDVLFGYAGQISFGHAAFFGIGAYASAMLSHYAGLSPWLGLVAGGMVAAGFGAVVGIPSLRLRGVYLALTTLAFAEVARVIVTNWQSVTRGTLGFNLHPRLTGIPGEPTAYYYVALGLAVVSVGFLWWLGERSRAGLILRAIRADEVRAQALGIDLLRWKLLAFAVSGFFAGVAGAFYAHYLQLISPNELAPNVTVIIIAMATIGGAGTIIGPAIAALLIHGLTEALHVVGAVYNLMALGAVLVLFVLFLPDGIGGLLRRRKS